MPPTLSVAPLNDANRLGLNYHAEAAALPWPGVIDDVHVHISGVEAARAFFRVADIYGIRRVWTQSPLEEVDALREAFGDRLEFIAIPNYAAKVRDDAWVADWFRRIEGFAARGCRIIKFWAAPRGRDYHPILRLDHPARLQAMRIARDMGMMFMTHVGDPDTWFATMYRDHRKYGTKPEQYEPLQRLLDEFHDVPWMAAHMAGDPERLDHLQDLLDRHPNLYLDTSATKWMVRELSKHPLQFRDFCRRNVGRVFFGTDIVVTPGNVDFDLYASRYWALRTLMETDYDGPSPIVDPDLALVDPSRPADATARLRGAQLDPSTLQSLYFDAANRLLVAVKSRPGSPTVGQA